MGRKVGRVKRPTSARMNKRGFTLIEITVVVAVIVILAATAVPGLFAARRSREARAFFSNLRDLGVRARNEAIRLPATVVLTYDEAETRFQLEVEVEEEGTSSLSRSTTQETEPAEERLQGTEVVVPEGITVQSFRANGDDTTASEWRIRFFPDGRSDGGGLQIEDAGIIQSWVVDDSGRERLLEVELTETEAERWEAGQHEQRL